MIAAGLLLMLLMGCAEELAQQPTRTRIGAAPAAPAIPSTPPISAPKPAPPPPKREPPKESASPYFWLMPYLGKWAARNEPAMTMTLDAGGHAQYGPLFKGTYRLLDPQTIELTLTPTQPTVIPSRAIVSLFRMEFYEAGKIMVFRQGEAGVVWERVP